MHGIQKQPFYHIVMQAEQIGQIFMFSFWNFHYDLI